jgi:hypothetical protein
VPCFRRALAFLEFSLEVAARLGVPPGLDRCDCVERSVEAVVAAPVEAVSPHAAAGGWHLGGARVRSVAGCLAEASDVACRRLIAKARRREGACARLRQRPASTIS